MKFYLGIFCKTCKKAYYNEAENLKPGDSVLLDSYFYDEANDFGRQHEGHNGIILKKFTPVGFDVSEYENIFYLSQTKNMKT